MAIRSKRLRFEILKRDRFTCRYCGQKAPNVVLHIDHVVAEANGGTDNPRNLISACSACNLGKGAQPLAYHVIPAIPMDPAELQSAVHIAIWAAIRNLLKAVRAFYNRGRLEDDRFEIRSMAYEARATLQMARAVTPDLWGDWLEVCRDEARRQYPRRVN